MTLSARKSAHQIADNASFQAFMNSYLKEVDPGVWHDSDVWQKQTGQSISPACHQVLEVKLPKQNLTLALGVSYRSIVGRHTLVEVFQKTLFEFHWQAIDFFSAIQSLIKEIYSPASDSNNDNALLKRESLRKKELELLSRVVESQQVMCHYLEQRLDDPKLQSTRFIDSEQAILFGHWLHPTPKSRQGIHEWQHSIYTPELCGKFQLHYFAVDRQLVRQNSIRDETTEQLLAKSLAMTPGSIPELADHMLLLPVHPLQAQWLLQQPQIQRRIKLGVMQDIGPLGAEFTATSSVRTLYCESLDFMIKLSIPVKVTNSLRINMDHELDAGMAVASLFRKTGFSENYPKFQTIDDPAYMTLDIEGHEQSGFELILRDNPFHNQDDRGQTASEPNIVSIAALTQDAIQPDQSSLLSNTIQQLAKQDQLSLRQAAVQWFGLYWQCAIETAIRLYDEHGIALEAHQQNSLLDISEGWPTRYFYRDNQGFYLSKTHSLTLLNQEPLLADTKELFYDDEMILNRFCYYLIVNQLFSVINRLGIDQLLPEQEALTLCAKWLEELKPQLQNQGIPLVDAILNQRDMACKGNLLTRIHDVDELQADQELAVYTRIKNPLRNLKPDQHSVSSSPLNQHAEQLNALISASQQPAGMAVTTETLTHEVSCESA